MPFALTVAAGLLSSCGRETNQPPAPDLSDSSPLATPAPRATFSPEELDVRPFNQVLGSYVTRYGCAGKAAPRAENIELAAKKLDGKVVAPGEDLSFNAAVGVRSKEAGFVEAPVIFMGELTPDVGGGVCQVSSTMHAAALASGLKVVRRLPHSRPSSYIMAGLDATVAFPPECESDGGMCYSSDLVVKNPFPWPIRVSTDVGVISDGGKECEVGVTFWGRDAQETKVSFSSTFSWTDDFQRRYRRHPWRKSATYRHKVQSGVRGRRAFLIVSTELPDGGQRVERHVSAYPPVDEIWEVGAAWTADGPPPWDPGDAGATAQDSGG